MTTTYACPGRATRQWETGDTDHHHCAVRLTTGKGRHRKWEA